MRKHLVIIFFIFILSGCEQNNKDEQIIQLRNQIAELKTQLDGIELSQAQFRGFTRAQLDLLGHNFAEFSPSSKGYQKINTSVGNFLISLDNIEKYINGYKISFSIGNINAVTYFSSVVVIQFGQPYDGLVDYTAWSKSLRTVQVTINKALIPEVWNKVTVILSPVKEEEINYMNVSLYPSESYLKVDWRKEVD
jgi:hypothetical protein